MARRMSRVGLTGEDRGKGNTSRVSSTVEQAGGTRRAYQESRTALTK
jgi:hypothetical protein